jgi:very-short-patch-repair endonuclease
MATRKDISYHGQLLSGKQAFADHVGLTLAMLKKLLAGNAEVEWEGVVDAYLRRFGRGPTAGLPPSRDEIEGYLVGIKGSGVMVSLGGAPRFLEHIRQETADLQCLEDAESVYCWRGQTKPPACHCGQPRKFNSLPTGYFPTCGANCAAGRGLGNPATRDAADATLARRADVVVAGGEPKDFREALRTLIERAGDKHYVQALEQHVQLRPWVEAQARELPEDSTWPERVHFALTGEPPWCSRGNRRRVSRLPAGYGFCGHQSKCTCSVESTGANLRATIRASAPFGHVPISEWAEAYGLNIGRVSADFFQGRMPGVQIGRNIFVPLEHEPPSVDVKVACAVCGESFLSITNTHLALHDGLTRDAYLAKYEGHQTIGSLASGKISDISRAQVRTEAWREKMRDGMLHYMKNLPEEIRQASYASEQESAFVAHLLSMGLKDEEILRQHPLWSNVPLLYDIVVPHLWMVVEIDGPQHWKRWIYACRGGRTPEQMFKLQQKTDKIRDSTVRNLGYSMYRIRVNSSLDDVEPFREQLRVQGFPEAYLGAADPTDKPAGKRRLEAAPIEIAPDGTMALMI